VFTTLIGDSPRYSPTKREFAKPSTPGNGTQVFRVTHPFHPLRGCEFALVDRRTTWGEDRVYYHDEKGRLRRLPAAWTSVAALSAFEVLSAGRSHFRIEDLLQLVTLIARLKEVRDAGVKGSDKRSVSRK